MNSSSSGGKLERFFTGKGFYIVLFLCAAVIGVSAWMMATGNETMEDVMAVNETGMDNKRVETIVLPPETARPQAKTEDAAEETEAMADESAEQEGALAVWNEEPAEESTADVYVWPVLGDMERSHDLSQLHYDETMKDWRTHEGIDVCAPVGTVVCAMHAGTVESIVEDDLYGVTMTINHGNGIVSVYANLAPETAVNAGDWVDAGMIVGSVGETAICESAQSEHLHFAVIANGESVDPLTYLPA